MELSDVKTEIAKYPPFAHLATSTPDGSPHVAPIHPDWDGDTLWVSSFANSVKARNIAENPRVALHWQVDESGDGVALWGSATVHTDLDTKRRLWNGVFSYDLNAFFPNGPESDGAAFIAIEPERVLVLKQYGMAGRDTWRR